MPFRLAACLWFGLLFAAGDAFAINDKNFDPGQQPSCVGAGVCYVPKFIEKARTIGAAEAAELAKRPDMVILDVRSRAEYERGHLPYALQVDDKELNADWLSIFLKSKDQPVLIYGNGPENPNASSAALIAIINDYTNVLYFYGGIAEWSRAKYTLVASRSKRS